MWIKGGFMNKDECTKVRNIKRKPKKHWSAFEIIFLVLLILYSISMIMPLSWGILTALKSQNDFRTNVLGFPKGWPWQWEWNNIKVIFDNFYVQSQTTINGMPALRTVYIEEQILNSMLYACVNAVIASVVPCAVAYVAAKFNYKFSKVLYYIVIVTMIVPIVGAYPSALAILRALGIYDTFIGSWIQHTNFLTVYFLVFYAGYKGLSNDYAEAAYIDGASEWSVMIGIMFPMMRTMLLTVILLMFISFWNDYQSPLLYLPTHPTLAYGVYYLSNTTRAGLNTLPMRMAGCTLLVVPILILFIFFHKRIMGNVSIGGIKE